MQRALGASVGVGDSIARYALSHGWGYLDAGRVFGNHTEMRTGLRVGRQSGDREIGDRSVPEISGEDYAGVTLRLTHDTRDRDVLWSDGTLVRATYFGSSGSLGADQPAPANYSCGHWTIDTGGSYGRFGCSLYDDWVSCGASPCYERRRLVCFEQ